MVNPPYGRFPSCRCVVFRVTGNTVRPAVGWHIVRLAQSPGAAAQAAAGLRKYDYAERGRGTTRHGAMERARTGQWGCTGKESGRVDSGEVVLDGEAGGGQARRDAQLVVDRAQVLADGPVADEQ